MGAEVKVDEDLQKSEYTETFLEKNKNSSLVLPWRDSLKQILAACIAHSLVIQVGINMAFSAVLLPQLRESTSQININQWQASWIASVVTAFPPLGALTVGPLMDKFGRKKICMLTTLPFLICWTLHNFATNVWYIYIARIIAGYGVGISTVALVYVSEISHPRYRPMLLTFNSVFVTLGILITCIFGYGLHWETMAKLFFLFISLSLVALFFIPESPYWLMVFQNDKKGSAQALKWLYTNEEIFEREYQRILSTTATLTEESNLKLKLLKMKEQLTLYKNPTVWKPLIILLIIFIFQQLSAAYVIVFYAVDIFRKIGGSFKDIGLIDEFKALILLGSIRFLMAIILAFISKRTGRRKLMFVSAIGMIISSISAGLYMYLTKTTEGSAIARVTTVPHIIASNQTTSIDTSNLETSLGTDGTVAVVLVLTYICFSSFGWLVIPWTLIGELLPVKVRGVLGGVMVSVAYMGMFLMVKIAPFLMDSVKLEFIFIGLGLVNVFGLIFLYFFLPETLGQTFEDIAKYFE